jgi:hypothetical protein
MDSLVATHERPAHGLGAAQSFSNSPVLPHLGLSSATIEFGMIEDPFGLLSPNATPKQIRRAYRRLAHTWHPGGWAEKLRLDAANAVLTHDWFRGPARAEPDPTMEAFLEEGSAEFAQTIDDILHRRPRKKKPALGPPPAGPLHEHPAHSLDHALVNHRHLSLLADRQEHRHAPRKSSRIADRGRPAAHSPPGEMPCHQPPSSVRSTASAGTGVPPCLVR